MTRPQSDAEKKAAAQRKIEEIERKEAEDTELREAGHAQHYRARAGDLDARAAIFGQVSGQLGFPAPITGLIKVTSDPPEFHVTLGPPEDTRLRLGGIAVLDTQIQFGRVFLETLGWKPLRVKAHEWDGVVTSLASCATDEEPDEALTDAGRGLRYIRNNLHARIGMGSTGLVDLNTADDDNKRYVTQRDLPFKKNGDVYVFTDGIKASIREATHGGENPLAREITRCLAAAGCERVAVKFSKPTGGALTTRSAWRVPAEIALYD